MLRCLPVRRARQTKGGEGHASGGRGTDRTSRQRRWRWLLSKERIIAGPAFNPLAGAARGAAIHLCIGMAYGFSVFWLPLTRAVNGKEPVACPSDMSVLRRALHHRLRLEDQRARHGCMHLFFVFLGAASAIWGGWLERAGPRKAAFVSACAGAAACCISPSASTSTSFGWCCWALGADRRHRPGPRLHRPVSTLIKWFPEPPRHGDRHGGRGLRRRRR
jgi:hypothetical protein